MNEFAIYDGCKEILGGAEFKSAAKDENLNASVPRKEQGARIGKTIWRLKLGAYLYTPVCLREGVLYFGTAGKGGDLYAVDAKSGEVVFKFKTSGTRSILFGSRIKFCSQTAKISQF